MMSFLPVHTAAAEEDTCPTLSQQLYNFESGVHVQ